MPRRARPKGETSLDAMDPLAAYRRKRDFARTGEPTGGRAARRPGAATREFVVQRHQASHLHYDFRLELHGVLKSWAVPKGPSLDPHVKRLAIEVEDHPFDYRTFEGTIPQGQYGAGEVVIWDKGDWEALEDADTGLSAGRLTFRLHGKRLAGDWLLVRMRRGARPQWLLRKLDDAHAAPGHDAEASQDGGSLPRTQESTADVRGVRITHPERRVFPGTRLTKLDVVRHYDRFALAMMPYVRRRPLALLRCPAGIGGECFFQKHWTAAGGHLPAGLASIEVPGDPQPYVMVESPEGIVALAQYGVIELHGWGARLPRLANPDQLTFDLDPDDGVAWPEVAEAAQLLRALLEELGLPVFLRTTGGKGLHLVTPLKRNRNWDQVRAFARAVASHLAALMPDRFTATMSKARRKGKIFIDYLRNGEGATAVVPYSVRARTGAPVAMPQPWEALSGRRDIRGERFTIASLEKASATVTDEAARHWREFDAARATLKVAAMKALSKHAPD